MKATIAAGPFCDFYAALLAKGRRPTMARRTLVPEDYSDPLIVWKRGVNSDAKYLN